MIINSLMGNFEDFLIVYYFSKIVIFIFAWLITIFLVIFESMFEVDLM
jgi:hypothetical protein